MKSTVSYLLEIIKVAFNLHCWYTVVFAFYKITMVTSQFYLLFFMGSHLSNAHLGYYIQLLSGGDFDIDVDDLINNTRYTGGYSEGSRTIKLFWEVLSKWRFKVSFS